MSPSLVRAFLSRLFTSGCGILAAFVSLKLYSLFLTKETYGVIFVGTQIMGYLPLTGAGFVGVLNQRVLTSRDRTSAVNLSRFAQFLQNCLFLIALVVALILMTGYSQTHLVKTSGLPIALFLTIGVTAAVTFYVTGQFSFLIGQGEQTKCYLLQGSLQLLTSFLLYVGFVRGMSVWAFPFSSGLAAFLLFFPLRGILRSRIEGLPLFVLQPQQGDRERFHDVWRPALHSLASQGWTMLTFSLDAILVGLIVGPGAAATYGVISRLTGISRHVLQALGETAWPRLAQHSNPELKANFMRKVDRLNAWNVGTWFGAMFGTIIPFLTWFLKADWVAGQLLIVMILLRHAVISLAGPHVFGIISLGMFREAAIISRREVMASVTPALILSYHWGTYGIAAGYLLGSFAVSGWQLTKVYFTAEHRPWLPEWRAVYGRFIIGAVLAYTLASTAWHLGALYGKFPGFVALFFGGAAFGLAWLMTAGIEIWRLLRRRANA